MVTERIRAMKVMWKLYAYGEVKFRRGHCAPTDALCAWCNTQMETAEHVLVECKDKEISKLRGKLHKKLARVVSEQMEDKEMAEWVGKMIPALWNNEVIELKDIQHAQVREAFTDMEKWNKADLWKGTVPKALIEMLRGLSIRKKAIHKMAQELVGVIEQAAVDIWFLTNEKRQEKPPAPEKGVAPVTDRHQAHALDTMGMLGRPPQQFDILHPAHRANIVAAGRKQVHSAKERETQLTPIGAKLRTYSPEGAEQYKIEGIVPGEDKPYRVSAGSALKGVFYISAKEATEWEIRDGITDQEQGIVHRALYLRQPKKRKRNKKTKRVNKGVSASVTTLKWNNETQEVDCAILTNEGRASVVPVSNILSTYKLGGIMKSRARRRQKARRRKLEVLGDSTDEEQNPPESGGGKGQPKKARKQPGANGPGSHDGGSPGEAKRKQDPSKKTTIQQSGDGGSSDRGGSRQPGPHQSRWVVPIEGHER